MPVATEVQAGVARIYGVAGAVTVTIITSPNVTSLGLTDNFQTDTIRSQNGATIETLIGAARQRDVVMEFIPSSAAGGTKQDAIDNAQAFMSTLTPLKVITVGGCSISDFNTTYNYTGGGEVMLKRDTYVVANVRASTFEVAAASGTFAALPIAT